MNKIIITIVVAVIIAFGGYFLLRDSGTPAPAPSSNFSPPSPTTSASIIQKTPSAEQNVVTYTDTGYSPSTLMVKRGEMVTFKNQSSRSMWPASAIHPTHMVYSGTSLSAHCPDIAGNAFDACKGFLSSESWSFKFDKTGTWKYHDHLNPGSTGTIAAE